MMGYIDPNTGGMLFQVLAAAFAVGSGLILVFSRQIRRGIARVRRSLRDLGAGSQQAEPQNEESGLHDEGE
jgi:hypothetical protein